MEEFLVGSGHFGFGFILGFILWRVATPGYKKSLNFQLYFPFIPFITGIYAALPYLIVNHSSDFSNWWNIFLFYKIIHNNQSVINILGQIHWVALICGLLYAFILYHYIELVKFCRRYGWNKGISDAG